MVFLFFQVKLRNLGVQKAHYYVVCTKTCFDMENLDIKLIREKLGVTQEQFAEMVGVHPRTIQNWEAGSAIPQSKRAILRQLMDAHNKEKANPNSPSSVEKLLEILAVKEASLAKAQEQIDRLLGIIEVLTKANN